MEFITQYVNIIILILCIGVGYIIKYSLDFIPNKYIPLIMGVVGIIANVIYAKSYGLDIITTGLITGLASTGCYELVTQLIDKTKNNIITKAGLTTTTTVETEKSEETTEAKNE